MKRLKFECTLLSDVIFNQKASTEGNNTTLDFIPGNVFLGIVAKSYDKFGTNAMEVFHSGKVRFGDAHPVAKDHPEVRTLRVPASLYYPKLQGLDGKLYVHHCYKRENDETKQQLKQCRSGFYAFGGTTEAYGAVVEKSFSIKSAYDSVMRRSRDEQMYGYESIDQGTKFLFDIEVDNDTLADDIKAALEGRRHVGRSRTAQYGLVNIRETDYQESRSTSTLVKLSDDDDYATVYADGRLIFFDDDDELTFQPTAEQLGIENGEIDWEKSQVRTFQYAPWNGQRHTRDTDRMGIEKGSVFVVKINGEKPDFASRYVGSYQNEGFGKVIYNPQFLEACLEKNGEATISLRTPNAEATNSGATTAINGATSLLQYLERKRKDLDNDAEIYTKVNDFVRNHCRIFNDESFASQWGAIRSIAMQGKSYDGICKALFDKASGYLCHGVAQSKWDERDRRKCLEKFVEAYKEQGLLVRKALVNLSSEMAKKMK